MRTRDLTPVEIQFHSTISTHKLTSDGLLPEHLLQHPDSLVVDDDGPGAGLALEEAPGPADGLEHHPGHAAAGAGAGAVDGVHALARGAGQLQVHGAYGLKTTTT